jgi:hypothetical protein
VRAKPTLKDRSNRTQRANFGIMRLNCENQKTFSSHRIKGFAAQKLANLILNHIRVYCADPISYKTIGCQHFSEKFCLKRQGQILEL